MKRGGGEVEIKKEKENRSKQIRPFTSKVAKLMEVGYANRDFKHKASNAGHFASDEAERRKLAQAQIK